MENSSRKKPLVMALGFFDGVHLGHQTLINQCINDAKKLGIDSSVMSFTKHPLTEIFPRYVPNLITNNKQKISKLKKLGIDHVFLEDFTEDLMKLSPEEFIKDFLLKKYDIKELVVGFNYTFGYKGKGKAVDLKRLGKQYDFDVKIMEPFNQSDLIVSSTEIRELLKRGNIEKANELLGHPFKVSGTISRGKRLGSKFEIPTANLKLDKDMIMPRNGVYRTKIYIDGQEYDGLTNLGYNPTFKNHPYSIETFIYDFDEDIYDKKVDLEFYNFIRGEKRFNSLDDLFNQIKSDRDYVKDTFLSKS